MSDERGQTPAGEQPAPSTATGADTIGPDKERREGKGRKRHPWWVLLLRWVGSILGILLLVLLLMTGILFLPSVQTPLTNRILASLEESTGMQMSVERVRVGFPGKLLLEELRALASTGDTVLYARRLTAQTDVLAYLKRSELPLSGVALTDARVDYHTPGDSLVVVGQIGSFGVSSAMLDGSFSDMTFGSVKLADTKVSVLVLPKPPKPRTGPKPTPPTIRWDRLVLKDVAASYASTPDSALVDVSIRSALLEKGLVDLPHQVYTADRIDLEGELYRAGTPIEMLPTPWDLALKSEAVRYHDADDLRALLRQVRFATGDGWTVEELRGDVRKDGERLVVGDLLLRLPQTELSGAADLPFTGWHPDSVGTVTAELRGRVTLPELSRFVSALEPMPQKPLRTSIHATGEWQSGVTADILIDEPSLLELKASARAQSLLGGGPMALSGHYELHTGPDITRTVPEVLGEKPRWQLPPQLHLIGTGSYSETRGAVDLHLSLPDGEMTLTGEYHPQAERYVADLVARRLDLGAFLPSDSLGILDAELHAGGKGTDIYSPKTEASLSLTIDTVVYKGRGYHDLIVMSQLERNHLFAAVNSDNEALRATAQLDLLLAKKDLNGSVNLYLDSVIPNQLGLPQSVVRAASLHLTSQLRSDMDQYYDFAGETSDFVLQMDNGELRPQETKIRALSTDSLLHASIESGDLSLAFSSSNGLREFQRRLSDAQEVITTSLRDTVETLDMSHWIAHYPDAELTVDMGRDNPLRYYLDRQRIGAREIHLAMSTDPTKGLRGEGFVQYFQTDTFRVDNIDLILRQDSAFVYGMVTAHKERFRNQSPFNAVLSFSSNVRRSEVALDWQDHLDRHFLTFGAEINNMPSGDLIFGFTPTPIVLAYNTFVPKAENYLMIPAADGAEITADIDLQSADGARIALKDLPTEGSRVLRAVITDLKLSSLESVPMLPHLEGTLSADVQQVRPRGAKASIIGTADLRDFIFEDKRIGDLALAASMVPEKSGQMIIAKLGIDEQDEAARMTAFTPKGQEMMMDLRVHRLPLELVNPFLPSDYAVASGELSAEIANYDTRQEIRSATPQPLEGLLSFHQGEVYVPALNETYLIADQQIPIRRGEALLNRFTLEVNDRKLMVNGRVGLEQKLPLALTVTGSNLSLLDSEETKETLVYGRINADTRLSVTGNAGDLAVRGNVSILGSSDFTYRAPKSRLSSRAGYRDLVTFTDFSDTLFVEQTSRLDSISLGGMTLALDLHIDPATRVTAILSPDEQTTISLAGGGDFNVDMKPYSPIGLTGIYDVTEGVVELNMSPIHRTFVIDNGSRLTWTGDLTSPVIDLTATSPVSSRVSLPGEAPRKVDFDVSIIAENTLDDLFLRFETKAPKDFAMRNHLATLSPEEQTRQSLILLTTGYFFGNDPSGNGSGGGGGNGQMVNNALAGLLTSQVNSFLGESLHADINFGITNDYTEAGERTDYTYSIAKGFLDDRIRVVVGGRVMTGAAAAGMEQSFIDNMSMEYRLDRAGTHYLRLFHNKNYENFLEGEVIETGIGYVLRRRLNSLSELFRFRPRRDTIPSYDDIPSLDRLSLEQPLELLKGSPDAETDSVATTTPDPVILERKEEE